ncbi:unnamed protein product [Mytilus coruscus]|uniref:Uncharacterized protein n=1 Tax=Mytilus coruscus TaxID=42192 RepID=A0A6J8CFN4_MYTCO|nr:unnamed protein product [Mytilus coruscus]
MKFEYFILIPFLYFLANGGQELCVNRCGERLNRSYNCQYYDAFCSANGLKTTNYISYETSFTTSDFHNESTSRSTTARRNDTVTAGTEESRSEDAFHLNQANIILYNILKSLGLQHNQNIICKFQPKATISGLIAGVTVSLTVVMLIVVVILGLVYRKILLRKQLLSKTVGNGKRTSKLNYYATKNVQEDQYHDIDIRNGDYCLAAAVSDDTGNINGAEDGEATYVRVISGVYDRLNEKDNRKIPTKNQNENAMKLEGVKMEIYTLTSYITAYQQQQDKSTKDFDKWIPTHAVDSDPTYNHSNNIIPREDLSAKTADLVDQIENRLEKAIKRHYHIILYFWSGTCDFTIKQGKFIKLRHNQEHNTVNSILTEYKRAVTIVEKYPNVEIKFVDCPILSIVNYNKHKGHTNPATFKVEDFLVTRQI